ncbi:MAG: flagellar FlbD family protein [Caldanaerobacter subterraneus]|nr:flagellar FlbD family protein [Caldanaerobacter subterraneus]
MIYVTRLNDEEFVVNADLIEFIEKTPDTVISLTTGKKIVVKETPEEVIERVIQYKRKIFAIERSKEVLE